MSKTMTRKKHKPLPIVASDEPEVVEEITPTLAAVAPKPKQFSPRPCTACAALRPANTNYSRVYSKHGKVRYCRCDFCNNTWAQYAD